jgi:hypothetical protein
MAVGASQGAAGAVAAGSAAGAAVGAAAAGGIIGTVAGTIAGASVGGQARVVVAAAVAVASVATGVTVRLEQNIVLQICPDNTNYDIYPGRLDIYFQTTDRFTLEEGEQLEDLVIERYNDFFGCDSVYNRVMLNTTMLRCVKQKKSAAKSLTRTLVQARNRFALRQLLEKRAIILV